MEALQPGPFQAVKAEPCRQVVSHYWMSSYTLTSCHNLALASLQHWNTKSNMHHSLTYGVMDSPNPNTHTRTHARTHTHTAWLDHLICTILLSLSLPPPLLGSLAPLMEEMEGWRESRWGGFGGVIETSGGWSPPSWQAAFVKHFPLCCLTLMIHQSTTMIDR